MIDKKTYSSRVHNERHLFSGHVTSEQSLQLHDQVNVLGHIKVTPRRLSIPVVVVVLVLVVSLLLTLTLHSSQVKNSKLSTYVVGLLLAAIGTRRRRVALFLLQVGPTVIRSVVRELVRSWVRYFGLLLRFDFGVVVTTALGTGASH